MAGFHANAPKPASPRHPSATVAMSSFLNTANPYAFPALARAPEPPTGDQANDKREQQANDGIGARQHAQSVRMGMRRERFMRLRGHAEGGHKRDELFHWIT